MNVYASTDVRECIALWNELLHTLPRDCRWTCSGDWNAVEHGEDKSMTCGKITIDGEKLLFEQLTSALKVKDAFPNTSPIKYSWDNKKQDRIKILARLDRMYLFQLVSVDTRPIVEYYIRGDNNHSNHLPILRKLLL
jgi:hypothetical protein